MGSIIVPSAQYSLYYSFLNVSSMWSCYNKHLIIYSVLYCGRRF